MNLKIVEAKQRLEAAQGVYRDLLVRVDNLLRAAVAQDPKNIAEAEAVQAEFDKVKFSATVLHALEQPVAVVPEVVAPPPAVEPPAPIVVASEEGNVFSQDLGRPAKAKKKE